jgi:hypothetical protein
MANQSPVPRPENLKHFTRADEDGSRLSKRVTGVKFTIEQTAYLDAIPDKGVYLRALVQADIDRRSADRS